MHVDATGNVRDAKTDKRQPSLDEQILDGKNRRILLCTECLRSIQSIRKERIKVRRQMLRQKAKIKKLESELRELRATEKSLRAAR